MQTSLGSSLVVLAALVAASNASADDLFIASTSTVVYQGTPFDATSNTIGACGGQAQSMVLDGQDLYIGDVLGRIYVRDHSTGVLLYAYDAPNDAQALLIHNGNLLVGGSDQTVARLDKNTGQVLSTIQAPVPVTAMALDGDMLYLGSSFGIVQRCDANTGAGMQFFGSCGGPVNSLVLDPTHMILGASNGFIYRVNRVTQQIDTSFAAGNDCEALVLHVGDILVGGTNHTVRRLERFTGAVKASWTQSVSVDALAILETGEPGSAYCFGTACPCGNDDAVGGCTNSSGFGSRLTGSGTASIGADDLRITAFSLPANKNGRFYMGGIQNQIPFGAGQLCTGASGYPLFRFPLSKASASGSFELANVASYANTQFPASGHIAAGSTWNFQGWFRDPAGPCGAAFNTTNAYSVTFLP
ncbi:MAG: PQQ-like beta-propeller repeat protein [Planctomycetes bacterium]|nr:PQQ-like beta-propeller repeat protein [Planctomycetota bacterium]